ncbi:ABC transporter ATP-binding protein [Candidatus Halobonum tyrrellensis]|uniref:Nickel import system ATP-binding protein NikD n=1 Tax=Candidatus Halobonum tyrrellensis G22 TaxID=1324957 RepID=V4IW46_9EURY|nr:ABC transporter ATP-binding protein [Candidatus Halobonum tyrrellensis]ESP87392.1 oligopeptide/dipeptide ABC transporter ATPase [Candidatus Halobonum tyrrellensis G22]
MSETESGERDDTGDPDEPTAPGDRGGRATGSDAPPDRAVDPLLEVTGLETQFPTDRGTVEAVAGTDIDIRPGEIVGLVGESGSGKSVLAESVVGMVDDPGRVVGGSICLRQVDVVREHAERFPDAVVDLTDAGAAADAADARTPTAAAASTLTGDEFVAIEERDPDGRIVRGFVDVRRAPEAALERLRGGRVSMVFQDPMNSLNPTLTVGEQIAETVRLHQDVGESVSLPAELKRKIVGAAKNGAAWRRAIEMLEAVEIPEAEARASDFPHEFSGGMRQRAMIAMALSCEPDLLIADEPTTALDVTIQAQILDELASLKDAFDTAILLITHDLAVVAETCDRVNVMYAGEIVERASAAELFADPQHPYTRGLIASTPRLSSPEAAVDPIEGNVPDLIDIPYACHFAPRCPESVRECFEVDPDFRSVAPDHEAACLRRGSEEERI